MRRNGYYIVNILGELEAKPYLGKQADLTPLTHLLVERYLRTVDKGWVFRAAGHYRGALQAEDEESGSEQFMLDLLGDRIWVHPNR